MELAPEEMEAMSGKQDGGVIKLAQDVGQGLAKLAEAMEAGSVASDEDKAQMGQILAMYVDLIENKLGGGEAPEPEQMSQVPMDAGPKGQAMSPAMRN